MQLDTEKLKEHRKKLAVAGVVIIAGVALFFWMSGGGVPDTPDPLDQYEEFENESVGVIQQSDGDTTINISGVTEQHSDYQTNTGYYVYEKDDERYFTEVSFTGVYKGSTFVSHHLINPEAPRDKRREAMVISATLHPTDDVIEGYMIAEIVTRNGEDIVKTNIYVDQDYREAVNGTMNISWGESWTNFRSYTFNEVAQNVYVDQVYSNNTAGMLHGSPEALQVAVGDFTLKEFREDKMDKWGPSIFMQ